MSEADGGQFEGGRIRAELGPGRDPAPQRFQARCASRLGPMLWIGTYTTLLSIVTLTVFRFWGRSQFRRRLWSETTFGDEALEYSGRGLELFIGFIIAAVFIMTPILVVILGAQLLLPVELAAIPIFLVYGFMFILSGVAIFMARRYHLSRTRLRGIRFAQTGSPWGYGWAFVGYQLLSSFTMGWYGPAARLRLSRRLWSNAWFGSLPFKFDDTPEALKEPVYRSFAIAWFGAFFAFIAWFASLMAFGGAEAFKTPTPDVKYIALIYVSLVPLLLLIGLSSAWHYAVMVRRIVKSLSVGGLKLSSNLSTMSIVYLAITNTLLVVFTLGFGFMAAQMRMWKRIANSISAEGAIDFTAVSQSADEGPKQGEGLADGLDLVANF